MRKIGILEDDEKLGKELKYFLETNGHEARYIGTDEYKGIKENELIDLLLKENFHLLLLDVGLPGFDGLHICKSYRDKAESPVIMITSNNSELTELMSLTNGADDFVPKPFNTQILLARMEMVMKRVYKDQKSSDVMTVNTNGATFTFEVQKVL